MLVPSAFRQATSAATTVIALALTTIGVGCSDYTEPVGPDASSNAGRAGNLHPGLGVTDSVGVLDWGEIGIATGSEDECGPWQNPGGPPPPDLGEGCDGPTLSECQMNPALAGCMVYPLCWIFPPFDCGPPGGGGGGNPEEVVSCPNCSAFEPAELEKLEDATEHICAARRGVVQNALAGGQYGERPHSWPIRGWHHRGYHTGNSNFHYSINQSHPGWTGQLYSGGNIGPTQQLIELAGTLVHEYFHHAYPAESESQIQNRTSNCVSGYIGS